MRAGVKKQQTVHQVPLLLVNSVQEEIPEFKFISQSRGVGFLDREPVDVTQVPSLFQQQNLGE